MSTIVLIADNGDNVSILSPMTFGNPNGIAAEAMRFVVMNPWCTINDVHNMKLQPLYSDSTD